MLLWGPLVLSFREGVVFPASACQPGGWVGDELRFGEVRVPGEALSSIQDGSDGCAFPGFVPGSASGLLADTTRVGVPELGEVFIERSVAPGFGRRRAVRRDDISEWQLAGC